MRADVDPDNLPVGELVDGWRVVRRLGGGAYGTVYLVEKGGKLFAMKVARFREQSRDERRTHERTQRELSCLLTMRHPCIAQVWGHGRWPHPQEGYLYIVMDYVEGSTLEQWQEQTRPTPREVVVLLDRVFDAVAYMHGLGILHRDLKPGNILVRARTGQPVVVDYGAAHFPVASGEKLTDQRLPPGTPRYTSPEAARFESLHRRDRAARYEFKVTDELYALGVILYDMLTDPQPWSHPQPQPLGGLKVAPAHEVNERVPVLLSHFAAHLLEREPARRPVSVEAARRELAEGLRLQAEEWTERPLHALPPQAPTEVEEQEQPPAAVAAVPEAVPSGPPRRGRGARTAAATSLGLGLLLACGAYLALRGSAPELPRPSSPVAVEAPPATSAPPPTNAPAPAAPPLVSPALPGPPAPGPSQPVSLQQKGPPVNARRTPEATVPSPCSQKQPPPRGTPQWVAWCKCALIVGTLAASQAGCPAVQVRQSLTAECSKDSVEAMKALEVDFRIQFHISTDVTKECTEPGTDWLHKRCCSEETNSHTCGEGGPITSMVRIGSGRLVPGTLLSGYITMYPPNAPTLTLVRWTEATLPDGSKHPVCIEYADGSHASWLPERGGGHCYCGLIGGHAVKKWLDTEELTR